jgi:hypothetical protein
VTVPTIPYASWPGRWQMYCTGPVRRVGAVTVALVEFRVADEPLVVDRVRVDQDERDRDTARHADLRSVEARVVDADRHRRRRRRAAAGDRRHAEEGDDNRHADRPVHAPAGGGPLAPRVARSSAIGTSTTSAAATSRKAAIGEARAGLAGLNGA